MLNHLSNRLRHLRIDNGKTKEELVLYLGITTKSYSRYETGERMPDLESLVKLSILYDADLNWLLGKNESTQLSEDISRSEVVSYKDLVDMGMNGKLAHGLITEIVSKQSFEQRIRLATGDRTKYAKIIDVKTLLLSLAELF